MKKVVCFRIPSGIKVFPEKKKIILEGPYSTKQIILNTCFSFLYLKNKNMIIGGFSLTKVKKRNTRLISQFNKLISEFKTSLKGLLTGFFVELKLKGVGYRFISCNNNLLVFKIGFSHNIYKQIPSKITLYLESPTRISMYCSDLNILSQVCSNLKKVRKLDSYKGKGLVLQNDFIILKEFKKK